MVGKCVCTLIQAPPTSDWLSFLPTYFSLPPPIFFFSSFPPPPAAHPSVHASSCPNETDQGYHQRRHQEAEEAASEMGPVLSRWVSHAHIFHPSTRTVEKFLIHKMKECGISFNTVCMKIKLHKLFQPWAIQCFNEYLIDLVCLPYSTNFSRDKVLRKNISQIQDSS